MLSLLGKKGTGQEQKDLATGASELVADISYAFKRHRNIQSLKILFELPLTDTHLYQESRTISNIAEVASYKGPLDWGCFLRYNPYIIMDGLRNA